MSTVLIVDDVQPMRDLLVQVVESLDLEAMEADSGIAMLKCLEEHKAKIGLILLDIGMPGISGIDALRRIRVANQDVKVCFISGETDKSVVADAIKAGGNDYVVKPIDVTILRQKIQKLLGQAVEEASFSSIETDMATTIAGVPIEIDMRTVALSEVAIVVASPVPMKEGERTSFAIPHLAALTAMDAPFEVEIDKVKDGGAGRHLLHCNFYGMHENRRSAIRKLVIRATPIIDNTAKPDDNG